MGLTYWHLYFSSKQWGILLDITKTANYLKPTMDCPNLKSELLKLANPLTWMNCLKIVVDTRALFKKCWWKHNFGEFWRPAKEVMTLPCRPSTCVNSIKIFYNPSLFFWIPCRKDLKTTQGCLGLPTYLICYR